MLRLWFRKWFRNESWRALLCSYHWYRKWYGGVWERWHWDDPYTRPWYVLEVPTSEAGQRPDIGCLGTPIVEDYREKNHVQEVVS